MQWQSMAYLNCQNKKFDDTLVRKLLRALFLLTLLTFCRISILYCQNSKLVFSHLDVNKGISDNFVKCIYKDSKGFVWFGTNSGLNRFDGYNIEVFQQNSSDSTSISDNSINAITADISGNLWVGTEEV